MILEIIALIPIYVLSMLLHELMHIKSQWLTTGTIWVHSLGMTCDSDETYNVELYHYAGGVYTSVAMFVMAALDATSIFALGFITMGWVQLVYGIYEGYTIHNIKWQRYLIYISVILINVVVWYLIIGV